MQHSPKRRVRCVLRHFCGAAPPLTYPSVTLSAIGAPLTEASPKVIYKTRGHIAYIVINRPQVLNA